MKKIVFSVILLGCLTGQIFSDDPVNIFSYKVGKYEVHMLVENRSQSSSSLLIGADEEMLKEYVPDGTYPSEVNTFLIKTPKQTILVDTGFGTTLFDNLKILGISPDTIDTVLITHMHGDHIGGLQKDGKMNFPKAKIYVSRQEKDYWTDEKKIAALPEAQQRNFRNAQQALAPYGRKVSTFVPGELGAKIKEILPGITPIAAFGHTPGHTAFLVTSDGEQLLIWGTWSMQWLFRFRSLMYRLPTMLIRKRRRRPEKKYSHTLLSGIFRLAECTLYIRQ
ncbi:MBL fold metallo-hydrolase [Brucepastera parasyntrophica]|uniref:MBL fold metallo-hydrolase n=1 Tax=Brucepastera parasyntrophica TaxID=2880008 RepID=UPI00210E353C|nr:MBL fold metallo-hydrolase [Brucepastera parasyntrophica]ULQ60995.1 MBL fold metallo-hydrolase [Brucepastera parasyntrophica]